MLRRALTVGEEARRLDDDIDTEVGPGQRRRVSLREHLERFAVDRDLALARLDLRLEDAMCRIVLEHVGENIGIREVVDSRDLEARALRKVRAVEVPPDPAE